MYKIYAGDTVIHYPPRFPAGYLVVNPVVEMEPNTHGSMSFTMLPDHPCYDDIETLNTIIRVFDDTEEIFRGRVIEITKDFYNQKEIYVEGELSFLVDSYYRPFGFQGSPADFFTVLIENHNSQVDESRQFTVGEITVTDSNDYINRSSEEPLSTWDVITSRLIDTLGGIVRTRLENGVRYIDYLEDYTNTSDQTIKFGESLLDIEDYVSAADIITCLIPYGAEYDSDDDNYTKQPTNGTYNGNRVTIEDANDGVDYVESSVGVALYGRIWGTNTWDDVTEAANLLTKAQDYVDAGVVAATTLTIKAVDLHLIDVDTERIKLGDYVRVYSRPHDLNVLLQCTKIKLNLADPKETEITLGAALTTFTSSVVSGSGSSYSSKYSFSQWLASSYTSTSDAVCYVEYGELTGNGTLYFSTAYESRPYYYLHTTDPDTGAVVSDSDATVEWVMYGNYYIGLTLSGLEEDATTLIVCYCSLPAEVDEEATDHEHSYSVSFAWAEDYSSCTATFVCSDCGNTQTISCTVTSQTTAATEDEDGETVYTATCTLSGTEYTDSQSVTIPATGDGWTLTHQWDLTSSAVDTVTDGEATLTGCVITENGLYFSAAAQNCYFGSVWGTNHAIEIDCGEMAPHSDTSVHLRTFMIYSSGLNKTEGLVWRYQTGAWAFYHDSAWESDLDFSDRNYFSGKTVRFESDSDGYLSLYVDGELVAQSTKAFANQTEVALGSYGASYYNAYYTAVRVYEKGSA